MSTVPSQPIRSPSYPHTGLSDALGSVRKIEAAYRSSQVDRLVAAKLLGYASLSGPANQALASLAQYGLVERAGKGEMRVTALAREILHPNSDDEKRKSLREAAFLPKLFQELRERWPDMVPPEDGVVTYLNRQGFNQTAIKPAARAYLQTLLFLEEAGASESHGTAPNEGAQRVPPVDDGGLERPKVIYGGARVGDLIQWETPAGFQLEKPTRVRVVHADGQWVAVDGSETGIPMSQVIVQERASGAQPPMFPAGLGELPTADLAPQAGEAEWMRNQLGSETKVRLLVTGEMGPKQIGKLIKLLKAQKAVLSDNDDDEADDD